MLEEALAAGPANPDDWETTVTVIDSNKNESDGNFLSDFTLFLAFLFWEEKKRPYLC